MYATAQLYSHCAAQLGDAAPPKPQPSRMDNQKLTAALGLKADATEFEIQAALETLRTEREEAAKLQEELKKTREARIKLLLGGAVSAGKIKPE